MNLFGVVRVTMRVTWPPQREAAVQSAAQVRPDTGPDTPPHAEPVVSEPVVSKPVAAGPVLPRPAGPALVSTQSAAPAADQAAVVDSLIGLADDLAGLADRAAGESAADRTLRLAQWRVDQVLAECGVQVVCDEGPVEPTRHEVVGSRPAAKDGTAGWIAETVRRGYLAGGHLIRPQQVVVYTASTTGATEGSHDAGRG